MNTVIKGKWVESRAARFLEESGLRILERNVTYRVGEIDIIAEDPVLGELVFVEVRGRVSALGRETPLESLGFGKLYRLRRAIEVHLSKKPREQLRRYRGIRIDLLGWDGFAWQWILDVREARPASAFGTRSRQADAGPAYSD